MIQVYLSNISHITHIMIKIAFIGAGSKGFGQKVITDFLAYPALRKNTLISLNDINESRLKFVKKWLETYKEDNIKELENVHFEASVDKEKCLTDAKYVISAFMVGGWEAYKVDVDIPYKYNVTQNVGDSLGPGGVFRFLRSVPVYKEVVETLKEVGYSAGTNGMRPIHLNYTNPMAMNTWYCNSIWEDSTVGLCHGVQGTSNLLRMYVGAAPNEFSYFCAGINHMAWFLDIQFKDCTVPDSKWVDAYPIIWDHVEEEPEIVGSEKVRWDMFKATGYFMTESSGHLSEYLPYYRKRKDILEKYRGAERGFDSLEHAVDMKNFERDSKRAEKRAEEEDITHMRFKSHPSHEYASGIVNAIETDVPYRFNGNVINKGQGLIINLPRGCCVEVPCYADAHRVHPQGGIKLPIQCQALCTSNIMVQKAAVEGALEKNKEKIYHAIMLDPNTASVCSPEEIREMVDEMFEAESKWLKWWNE
ncbi:MAG: alpha-glucosidase/alpha-galactosidase [Candidatus Lokiarchaeota archaeon]|nr:alpha-glucosidase/alpha-galactosidase [Candidatus Lokiarchaeota archaeon]